MPRPALLLLLPLGLLLGPALMANAFLHRSSPLTTTTRRAASGSSRGRLAVAVMMAADWALLFDCDGVLADTERDGHRPAFNLAFERKGIACGA